MVKSTSFLRFAICQPRQARGEARLGTNRKGGAPGTSGIARCITMKSVTLSSWERYGYGVNQEQAATALSVRTHYLRPFVGCERRGTVRGDGANEEDQAANSISTSYSQDRQQTPSIRGTKPVKAIAWTGCLISMHIHRQPEPR